MKRILIIGKTSYIGTSFQNYVQNYAREEAEVTMLSSRNEEWKACDFSKYHTVIHVAAVVHKKEQPEMEALYRQVNQEFPVAVAKKAKAAGIEKFIFLSTMAVYGNVPSPITKHTAKHPATMYGKTKLAAEKELKQLADDRFHVTIVRPPMVYGPGCPGNYGRLEKLSRILPCFPKVNNKRSMIYIENLCACIWQEIKEDTKTLCISCPQNAECVNTTKLVCEIRRALGKNTLVIPLGNMPLRFLAKKIGIFGKIFGDYYYEPATEKYQIVDFKTSIERTEI